MFNLKRFLGLQFYSSELDDFLAELAKTYPKLSDAQLAEKMKYERIYRLRDNKIPLAKDKDPFWEHF